MYSVLVTNVEIEITRSYLLYCLEQCFPTGTFCYKTIGTAMMHFHHGHFVIVYTDSQYWHRWMFGLSPKGGFCSRRAVTIKYNAGYRIAIAVACVHECRMAMCNEPIMPHYVWVASDIFCTGVRAAKGLWGNPTFCSNA